MKELIYEKSYEEYKEELGEELTMAAESFVRIGYLLKVARDTDVLATSGYVSVAEFAKAEFGIDKTQVSRFISINDKYAENGYSDRLREEYRGYGYSKLTIMLQLPDSISEELTPSYSKAEIQALKEEIDKEKEVSDIERVLEGQNPLEKGLEEQDEYKATLFKAVLQLGEDDPELYIKISERMNEDIAAVLTEIMAPSGDKTYSIRVVGVGRLMLMISDMSEYVKLVNSRTGEKLVFTWTEMAQAWIYAGVLGSATEKQTPIACWEQRYEKKCPIAPVQHLHQPIIDKPAKKETKVRKASESRKKVVNQGTQETLHNIDKTIPEPVEKTEEKESEKPINTKCDEPYEVEGQTSVEDFPEMMPEKESIDGEFSEITENEKKCTENEENAQKDSGNDQNNAEVIAEEQAVTNDLRTLKLIWDGTNPSRIELMLDTARQLTSHLGRLLELEEGGREE